MYNIRGVGTMKKILIPDMYCKDIYSIDYKLLKDKNIKE